MLLHRLGREQRSLSAVAVAAGVVDELNVVQLARPYWTAVGNRLIADGLLCLLVFETCFPAFATERRWPCRMVLDLRPLVPRA